jgi:hypothetical protein
MSGKSANNRKTKTPHTQTVEKDPKRILGSISVVVNRIDFINLIIGALIGALIGWGVAHYYYSKSESLNYQSVQRMIPRLRSLPALFKVGNGLVQIPEAGGRVMLSNVSPWAFEVSRDGAVLLNGQIRNKNGMAVAYINNSLLYVSPGVNYDVNSDMSALEVVDDNLIPVMQLRLLSPEERDAFIDNSPNQAIRKMPKVDTLEVYYVSYAVAPDKSGTLVEIADANGITITGNLSSVSERIKSLRPIFKYPGCRNPGVRR